MKKTFVLLMLVVAGLLCMAPAAPLTTSSASTAPTVAQPAAQPAPQPAAPTPTDAPAAPVADVPAPESGVTDAGETTQLLIDATHKREWGIAVGAALMLLVWIVGFFWKALPSAWLPWLSIALGVASTMGIDLSNGLPWWRALLTGLSSGMIAVGSWETLGRRLLGSRSKRLAKGKA